MEVETALSDQRRVRIGLTAPPLPNCKADSMDEARSLANGDPMHSTDARMYTLKKWLINEGHLNISVSLETRVTGLD